MQQRAVVHPARAADLPALAQLDLHYDASRVLSISRVEWDDGYSFEVSWIDRGPKTELYNAYDVARLRNAMSKVDHFAVAEIDGAAVGLLMVMIPAWTDAGEITDLAIDRNARRMGVGTALVESAIDFARSRGLRGLWVEPRSDNAAAIEFYRRLNFRLNGFNDRMYSNEDDRPGRTTLFMFRELIQPGPEMPG